ncbi:MAG: methyltransferase domain-containing protein [Phycisphaerales bacterium]
MAAFEFDDWFPLDDEDHHAQVAGLLDLLSDGPKRILDIGCGDGRVLKPLADAGHIAWGIDTDPCAVEACARKRLDASVGDALDPACDITVHGAPPDAVLCLGHTFMLLTDPVAVLAMLTRIRCSLAGGGFFAIDAFCEPLWREVSEGYWQSGVAEDGQSQLVWALRVTTFWPFAAATRSMRTRGRLSHRPPDAVVVEGRAPAARAGRRIYRTGAPRHRLPDRYARRPIAPVRPTCGPCR